VAIALGTPWPARDGVARAGGPEPQVELVSMHAGSGVLTAVLDSGVVVRHRRMDTARGTQPAQPWAALRMTIAPASRLDAPEARALVFAADEAWGLAVESHPEQAERLARAGLRLRAYPAPDAVCLEVSGPAAALPEGARVLAALLAATQAEASPAEFGTDANRPDPDPHPRFESWRTRALAALDAKRADPVRAAELEAWSAGRAPDDPWLVGFTPEALKAADARVMRRVLASVVRTGSVVCAVVGEVDAQAAVDAAALATGAFAGPRPAPSGGAGGPGATPSPHPSTPIQRRVERRIDLQGGGEPGQSVVVVGVRFPIGSGADGLSTVRRMITAATVLEARLNQAIPTGPDEPERLVVKIDPGPPGGGFGMLWVTQRMPRGDEADHVSRVERVCESLAEVGPTPEEMAAGRRELARLVDASLDGPGVWLARLGDLDRRGMTLDDVVGMKRSYLGITPREAADAFRAAWWSGSVVVVTAAPGAANE
jgi:hypothetical protein